MPKLVIDDQEIEVAPGTKVIEAAEWLGIMIPRFCFHPALGSVGACRVCAVAFLGGPFRGVNMSCMVEARDGMIVSTTDKEAMDFRKHVIEWLMLNHPHDCPVCDEGGHCLLQDMTVSGGHAIRRYEGKKRTYLDQDLGPLVRHEMNRCIHCWRCRRFYQEFAGYRDLGAMGLADRTFFGRFAEGPLESPFSGNLIDICPTGVFTDKPSRFKGRRWDYQRAQSICIHCSLGCKTVSSARYREVVRIEAGFSEQVNGHFICDRGRYGFDFTNHPQRPRRARIGAQEVPLEKAVQTAVSRLREIADQHGPAAIASVGSARSALESQAMAAWLSQAQGWFGPAFFPDAATARKVRTAISRLDDRLAVSLREIEDADFILAVGADPMNEAPMLALAIRQAWRRGAFVTVVDPRPVEMPFTFVNLPMSPRDLGPCLSALIKGAVDRSQAEALGPEALAFHDAVLEDDQWPEEIRASMLGVVEALRGSLRPVIVCGTDVAAEDTVSLAADSALLLAAKARAGLSFLMPGSNAFGAGHLSPEGPSLAEILVGIDKGALRALVLVEADPLASFPDRERLERALARLDLLVVMDYLPSRTAEKAHVFLPTATPFETQSSFVNQEGRLQIAQVVHPVGIPVEQLTAGQHPPRSFRNDIPGGEAQPAWETTARLAEGLGSPAGVDGEKGIRAWLANAYPSLASALRGGDGRRVDWGALAGEPFSSNARGLKHEEEFKAEGLELLLVDWIFGTEELSLYSRLTPQVERPPTAFVHARDAVRMGLQDGETVRLHLERGRLEISVAVRQNMASGVLILPRHRHLPWQRIKETPARVSIGSVERLW